MRAVQNIHHSTMTLEDIEDSIISLQYHLEGEGESGDEKRALIRRLIERKNAIKGAVLTSRSSR